MQKFLFIQFLAALSLGAGLKEGLVVVSSGRDFRFFQIRVSKTKKKPQAESDTGRERPRSLCIFHSTFSNKSNGFNLNNEGIVLAI